MNKQILEIAEQSGLKVDDEGVIAAAHFGSVSDGYIKFAELLIRECARIDSEMNNPDHVDGVSYNYTILEHFGIEQ